MKATPHLVLRALDPRFVLAHDPLGWRINIGEDAYVRPDNRGRITSWAHAEGTDPEAVRRDIDLLKALIRGVFERHERLAHFSDPHSTMRERALSEICDLANDAVWSGTVSDFIGRDN